MAVIRLFCLVFYFLNFRFLLITVNATFSLKFTDKVNLNDTALMGDNIQFVVSALGHSLFSARLTRAPSGELLRNYWREKSTNNPFPCSHSQAQELFYEMLTVNLVPFLPFCEHNFSESCGCVFIKFRIGVRRDLGFRNSWLDYGRRPASVSRYKVYASIQHFVTLAGWLVLLHFLTIKGGVEGFA